MPLSTVLTANASSIEATSLPVHSNKDVIGSFLR